MGGFEKQLEARASRWSVVQVHWLMAQETGWALGQGRGVLYQCLEVQQKSMEMAAVTGGAVAEIDSLVSTPVLETLHPWTASIPCREEMQLLLQALGMLLALVQEPLATLTMAVVAPALLLVLVAVVALIG